MSPDLIVISGAPVGCHADLDAANNGFRVSLFEAKRLGGMCLNEGCIPSKSLLHITRLFSDQLGHN